jgi:hypothetical protein
LAEFRKEAREAEAISCAKKAKEEAVEEYDE